MLKDQVANLEKSLKEEQDQHDALSQHNLALQNKLNDKVCNNIFPLPCVFIVPAMA